MESLNNAFTGGLIDHLLRVASYAVKFNTALPENERVDQISLLKVFYTKLVKLKHLNHASQMAS
jgi:hypothetical protein